MAFHVLMMLECCCEVFKNNIMLISLKHTTVCVKQKIVFELFVCVLSFQDPVKE